MNDTADNSGLVSLRTINNANLNLAEMTYHASSMAVLIEALKQKSVRLNEASFDNGEIVHQNENIMILRGAAYEVVHRAFKGDEGSLAGKKVRHRNLSLCCRSQSATMIYLHLLHRLSASYRLLYTVKWGAHIFEKRSLPNGQKLGGARTGEKYSWNPACLNRRNRRLRGRWNIAGRFGLMATPVALPTKCNQLE